MGNSMRHTLSHMCGTQATKGVHDPEQPFSRPKRKKSKKGKTDPLDSIKEENEGKSGDTNHKNNGDLSQAQDRENVSDDLVDGSQCPIADSADRSIKVDHLPVSVPSPVPVITVDQPSDTTTSLPDEEDGASGMVGSSGQNNPNEALDNISIHSATNLDELSNTSIVVSNIRPFTWEVLGIQESDKVFEAASIALVPYVENGCRLQDAVQQLQRDVDQEKMATDFLALWQIFNEFLADDAKRDDSAYKTDFLTDMEVLRSAATCFLQTIKSVKPTINKCVLDARKVDVIECTKDKILEGDSGTGCDKLTMPAKHRSNTSRLQRCSRQITVLELETHGILHGVQEYIENNRPQRTEVSEDDRESLLYEQVLPDTKTGDNLDQLFLSLSQEIPVVHSDPEGDDDNGSRQRPHTPLPLDNTNLKGSHSELSPDQDVYIKVYYESDETSTCSRESIKTEDDPNIRTVSVSMEDLIADEPTDFNIPEEQVQSYVLRSVTENRSSNPLHRVSAQLRECHTPPLMLENEPDHNTLDYGNYVFIDPSTGDIQVMRNRSRSLDSLVSMTSSRSSISRFGSFEFVTDFEINIAEKNQEKMSAK